MADRLEQALPLRPPGEPRRALSPSPTGGPLLQAPSYAPTSGSPGPGQRGSAPSTSWPCSARRAFAPAHLKTRETLPDSGTATYDSGDEDSRQDAERGAYRQPVANS
ncbi:hypothetical protein ACWDZ6_20220 [Streptomyces sp. NPDC002926]